MRIAMDCGLDRLEFEVADDKLIPGPQPPAALADPAAAVRAALETPHGYPALRRALTPDDHVTIVVDEQLPHLAELLVPLLEHIASAGVTPETTTLLCPPSSSRQSWIEDLPDAFQEVHVEIADPGERRRMAYLATTHKGKRLYLNRTLVEADQIVVLSGRWWIESMDGTRIEQGPGEFSFGEDQSCNEIEGKKGHRSGTIGREPAVLMTVQLHVHPSRAACHLG